MKRLQYVAATTFMVGLLSLLFFTFGQLAWNIYGIGLYQNESILLLAWILLMFGTAFYYGVMYVILYPEDARKKWEKGKWNHF